jgi:hypothetical protein
MHLQEGSTPEKVQRTQKEFPEYIQTFSTSYLDKKLIWTCILCVKLFFDKKDFEIFSKGHEEEYYLEIDLDKKFRLYLHLHHIL